MTTAQLSTPLPRTRAIGDAAAPAGRSLLSYLLVPRPKDLVKALVVPLTFTIGAVAAGGVTATQLIRLLLVWAALELLVYQARYQWNDVRGFAADQAHPEAASRGRLPGPIEKARPHITASLLVAALRLALTAALAVAMPAVAGVVIAMTVGVFGVALVYERLRSHATGRTAQVPVPLRPALVSLWVAVGAGYAVRGLTGLALATSLAGRPGVVVSATVAMWALGIVFVTCRWALEAMCFAATDGSRLVWEVRPDQAREHTLGLVRWLPTSAPELAETDPCAWRPLQLRTPLTAPWHLALVVAAAAAALTGRLLVAGGGGGALPAAVAGGTAALVIAASPGSRTIATVAGAALLGALDILSGAHRVVAATLPWLVVLVAYGCFTRQCADEIGHPLRRLQPLLRR